MNDFDNLTEERLVAIMGEDPTILAELLRTKQAAEDRSNESYQTKHDGRGATVFDPLGVIANVVNRRRAGKEMAATGGKVDEQLARQKGDKLTYAKALLGSQQPAAPAMPPRAVDSSIPPSPVAPQSAPTTFFNPNAGKPPAPAAAPAPAPAPRPPVAPPGLGPMPTGEPLRGAPQPGMARPPLANAQGMDPAALQAAGVPPDIQALLAKLRGR